MAVISLRHSDMATKKEKATKWQDKFISLIFILLLSPLFLFVPLAGWLAGLNWVGNGVALGEH